MIICALSISPALSSNDLTGTQTAAIAEREHDADLEIAGHGKEPIGLVWAHGQRQLLRLLEVVDLGRQIVPPQRDAEQELHPGHDPVTIGYAEAGFDQMQLKAANVVGRRRVGAALEECREALAAIDVAALRMGPELARGHVLDHALTKLTDGGICAHGELLLSEVAKTSIFPQDGAPHPAFVSSQLAAKPSIAHPAQRLSRQRFSGVPSMIDSLGVKIPCPT